MKNQVLFLCYFIYIFTVDCYLVDVIPGRPEVEYINPKYGELINVSVLRTNRSSPYFFSISFRATIDGGENLSFEAVVLEYLSGGYHPTIMRASGKVCDYYCNDPHLGKLLRSQIPPDITCPIELNRTYSFVLRWYPLEVDFQVPFTFSSMKGRGDGHLFVTKTKETVAKGRMYFTAKFISNKTNLITRRLK